MNTAVRTTVCATVDVEDFYEGMAVLGAPVTTGQRHGDGLRSLADQLAADPASPKLTLFVVGGYAPAVRAGLAACATAGHEVASHGPDHGRLPAEGLVGWLRRGRDMLEQLLGVSVVGFRSPRFDVPPCGLAAFRDALAEAGFRYVSDTSLLGPTSPVHELPVLDWGRLRVGGGSYQRFLPGRVVDAALARAGHPAVLYYHSYDFDGSLPGLGAVRSLALAKQLVARDRVARQFLRLTGRYGSRTCADVAG